MFVLDLLFWLILILVVFFILLLFLNLRVKLQGHWQDSLEFNLLIGVGSLYLEQQTNSNEEREHIIRLGRQVLYRKTNSPPTQKKPEARERHALQDVRPFLQGDFLQSIVRTLQNIFSQVHEKEVCMRGYWGFSDPYYTGLLAACIAVIPGLEVKPVFNEAYRDLEFTVGGRLSIGILVYYLAKFVVSRESRRVWSAVRKNKKAKNFSKGATPWQAPVYSKVKQ